MLSILDISLGFVCFAFILCEVVLLTQIKKLRHGKLKRTPLVLTVNQGRGRDLVCGTQVLVVSLLPHCKWCKSGIHRLEQRVYITPFKIIPLSVNQY